MQILPEQIRFGSASFMKMCWETKKKRLQLNYSAAISLTNSVFWFQLVLLVIHAIVEVHLNNSAHQRVRQVAH